MQNVYFIFFGLNKTFESNPNCEVFTILIYIVLYRGVMSHAVLKYIQYVVRFEHRLSSILLFLIPFKFVNMFFEIYNTFTKAVMNNSNSLKQTQR